MNEPKVIVWYDARTTPKWMVTVMGSSGRIDSETPYQNESDAAAIANTIGRSRGCPVYHRTSEGKEQLVQH